MSDSTISIERRDSTRVASPLKSKFRILERVTHKRVSKWENSIVDNISLGGIDILINKVTEEEISEIKDENNIFEIKIYFPEGIELASTKGDFRFIRRIGKAVWEYNNEYYYEVGIKFLDMEPGPQEIINNFIKRESKN